MSEPSEESRRLVDGLGAAEQRVIVKDTNSAVFSAITARDALLSYIAALERVVEAIRRDHEKGHLGPCWYCAELRKIAAPATTGNP